MQPSAQEKEVKTVPSLASCGGKRQWCPGRSEHTAHWYVWQDNVKASANKAWQISPIWLRAFVLDGAKRFQDKVGPCRRTHKGISPFERKKITRLILEILRNSEYSAVRQFLFAKNFAGRGWHHGRTNMEVNWYPREQNIKATGRQ